MEGDNGCCQFHFVFDRNWCQSLRFLGLWFHFVCGWNQSRLSVIEFHHKKDLRSPETRWYLMVKWGHCVIASQSSTRIHQWHSTTSMMWILLLGFDAIPSAEIRGYLHWHKGQFVHESITNQFPCVLFSNYLVLIVKFSLVYGYALHYWQHLFLDSQ